MDQVEDARMASGEDWSAEQRLTGSPERPAARPVTRGRGLYQKPVEEKQRRVVFLDHHHVHHHHHFHSPADWDGAPGDLPPDALQRCHEQKVEKDVERCIEQTGTGTPPPAPEKTRRSRAPRKNAAVRQEVGAGSADILEASIGLHTSTFSHRGRGDTGNVLESAEASWLASVSNPLPAVDGVEPKKQVPELQLQQYFEVMSVLPMQTRLKLSPYAVQLGGR
mmetsp:Transcript_6712/g.15564  ORF Transcript_6712/g.15564 Transcript_6712/m.15564 type:complete len:222 (+) Transcript_6712:99-764(+)